jgi:predicted DNA-binding transcriptional regulator YafY
MSEKASRLLRIYQKLKKGPITIDNLIHWAKKNNIEVSERSLYRDMDELALLPLEDGEELKVTTGEKNKKTWKIEYNNSRNEFNVYDLYSFYLLRNFSPLAITVSRQKTLDKFEQFFYSGFSKSKFEKTAAIAENALANTHFFESSYSDQYHTLLEECIWAIQNQRKMIIENLRNDFTSLPDNIDFPLSFLPLQVIYHRGSLHLSGMLNHNQDDIMLFSISQLDKYSLTNEMFDTGNILERYNELMGQRFGITTNIDDRVYDIEIEFSALTASFVVHHFWHPSQQFSYLENGNCRFSLRCGINRELAGWVFQWMDNAKVIEPKILRDLVEEKIRSLSRLYSEDGYPRSNNVFKRK